MADTAYKYSGEGGLNILQTLELKITPPDQFNDPFEFVPHVVSSNPKREINRHLKGKDVVREMFEFEKQNGKFSGNFRQYREHFKKGRARMAVLLSEDYSDLADRLQSNFQNNLSDKVGVLCMASNRTSIVMWGHYCDKHRGLVIGFDMSYATFRLDMGMRPVEYVRERPIFDTSWNRGSAQEESFKKTDFLKNDEWKYEEELRQVFRLQGLNKRRLDDNSIGCFLPFEPSALVSVTLGAKASKSFEKTVRSTLSQPQFSHITLERARLHKREFQMEFDRV